MHAWRHEEARRSQLEAKWQPACCHPARQLKRSRERLRLGHARQLV